MSAINTFALQNVIVSLRTCACVRIFAQETTPQPVVPKVTARWMVETDKNGTCRLVRHWFENETTV